MDRLYLILSTITLVFILAIHTSFSYAQVQDKTIAGIIVPKFISTQNQYCPDGICGTGGTPSIPVNYTHSNYHLPIIFVSLSQTCENMLRYHISGCPTLESMVPFDTSNQYVSGKFVKIGNDTIRTKPEIKNNWLYYAGKTSKTVCIECTADIPVMQQSQQIIIQPTGFSFVDQIANATKGNWISYSDRYMQGCDTATISNDILLLNDTIQYMLHGCTKTSFNYTSIHKVNDTPWQYDNAYSTLHQDSYLKTILHGHHIFGNMTFGGLGPTDCISHQCSFIDPYHKAGY